MNLDDSNVPSLPSEFQNHSYAPLYSASFVFLSSWGSCRGKGKHFRTKLYLCLLFIHLHVLSLLLLKEEKKLAFPAPCESSTHTSQSLNPFLKRQHFFQQAFLCKHQSIKCGLFSQGQSVRRVNWLFALDLEGEGWVLYPWIASSPTDLESLLLNVAWEWAAKNSLPD